MPFEPTDEQQAILEHHPDRHARVLAGPGTGKSTTMVALLDRLLSQHDSLRVRMLTFTRAATAELAQKITSHSDQVNRPSTIHSFAISILLRNPGTGGFPEPLRIPDTWEYKNLVRPNLAHRAGVTVSILNKLIQEMASNWESLTEQMNPEITEADRARFIGAWDEQRRILGYTLLQELPYALHGALNNHDDLDGINFDLLIVDEYQDLNACDLDVIRLLSEKGECKVIGTGDDDQSIYSWRNAAPEGIRRFLDTYDQAEDYTLSVTLRCGKKIIEWANHVIQGDPDRPPERTVLVPLPDSPDGEVGLLNFPGDKSEAKGIATLVESLINDGMEPNDILILMRTDHNGTFSNPIREEIEKLNITCSDPSYVISLLEMDDNRKLLEMLRLLVNKYDSISWASILKLTPGVGPTFFRHIYDKARETGSTFADELLLGFENDFPDGPPSKKKVIEAMSFILDSFVAVELPTEKPEMGWGGWIINFTENNDFAPTPTEEFQELLLALDELTEDNQPLDRYLGQIEPLGKDLSLAKSNGVRIMTMGGSKGLTVRATIIAGVEEGLVPRPESEVSEERRILYVAMTRAKEYLFCTWAGRRRGPTARAGRGSTTRRHYCNFLNGGPVNSENGVNFLKTKS